MNDTQTFFLCTLKINFFFCEREKALTSYLNQSHQFSDLIFRFLRIARNLMTKLNQFYRNDDDDHA